MGKKKKGLGARAFAVPILIVRTPEQHRAIIQPASTPTKQVSLRKGPRPPRSRAKRKRLANLNTGTASLGGRVQLMGLRKYTDYLASPHWLDVKARWKASNMFKGWVCHTVGCDSRIGLSLHHWTYERLGREELTDLILVCENCHSHIHSLERGGMTLEDATRRVTKQHLRHAPQPNQRSDRQLSETLTKIITDNPTLRLRIDYEPGHWSVIVVTKDDAIAGIGGGETLEEAARKARKLDYPSKYNPRATNAA